MIKVSIIVPVYNTEKYLKECLDSLINQIYKNIEIVCVNDGSSDNSLQILEEYKSKDNRIIIINQENLGANITRTNGIKNSTGDYLMFLDSDDWITLDAINHLVEKIEKTNADIIKFDFINRKTIHTIKQKLYNSKEKEKLYNKLLTTQELNNLTTEIINKNICNLDAEVFKNRSSAGEDLAMNLDIYDKANSILITNQSYYFYRKNENSTTNTSNKEILYNNIAKNKKSYLFKYAKKWNLLTEDLEEKLLIRQFRFNYSYIIRILETKDFISEDKSKLDYIIDNYDIIQKIKSKKLIDKMQDKKINKIIIKLILDKKYDKAIKLLKIKRYIRKLFFWR